MNGRLFLLDDDELISAMLNRALKKEGYETQSETSPDDIINKIFSWCPDLVLLDIHLDEFVTGLDILKELKEKDFSGQVVMLTADDSAETAITAMKLGATDYLTKPFNMDEVKIVIRNIIERERLKEEVDYLRKSQTEQHEEKMIGESPSMQEFKKQAATLAEAHVNTVLITGESGTGKEVMARFIHDCVHPDSNDAYAPFVAINCTALPEQLFESELFGHVKGAFTGASSDKKGLFELANGGTILLDEVGDMHPSLQSKLLRVLEDRKVRRVGGKVDIPIDVMVIATTNADLEVAVNEHKFRMDLFYRMNTFPLHIPPLRERKEDIQLLANHFLAMFAKKYAKRVIKNFSPEAKKALYSHEWIGNVRELKNVVERIVVLENVETLTPEHLPVALTQRVPVERRSSDRYVLPEEGISLEEVERDLIGQALERTGNNQAKAAKLLNVTYDTLRYQIKKFRLL